MKNTVKMSEIAPKMSEEAVISTVVALVKLREMERNLTEEEKWSRAYAQEKREYDKRFVAIDLTIGARQSYNPQCYPLRGIVRDMIKALQSSLDRAVLYGCAVPKYRIVASGKVLFQN